jgi:hypothetical protein
MAQCAEKTSGSQTVPSDFQAVPIRSQAFPNAPKQFPNDSQMFPILCLIDFGLNTWPFPEEYRRPCKSSFLRFYARRRNARGTARRPFPTGLCPPCPLARASGFDAIRSRSGLRSAALSIATSMTEERPKVVFLGRSCLRSGSILCASWVCSVSVPSCKTPGKHGENRELKTRERIRINTARYAPPNPLFGPPTRMVYLQHG